MIITTDNRKYLLKLLADTDEAVIRIFRDRVVMSNCKIGKPDDELFTIECEGCFNAEGRDEFFPLFADPRYLESAVKYSRNGDELSVYMQDSAPQLSRLNLGGAEISINGISAKGIMIWAMITRKRKEDIDYSHFWLTQKFFSVHGIVPSP